MKLLGAVIAGGLSRRMGETDKLWLELNGEALIARAARRLGAQTGEVVLNVNRPDERLHALGLPIVPDMNADYQGPLAGIAAMLGWTAENRPDVTHLVACSVDSPFFPDDLGAHLTAGSRGNPGEIAIAFSKDYPQPVFGLWPVACHAALIRFLEETGNLKVMAFVRSQPWRRVDFPPGDPPAFFNINTPEDHAEAERFVAKEKAA
jgi:molybdopterin-guanine dinucleotide biosynthesis protein A